MLLRAGRFGDLRRKILSWWRSARLSISSEARDRNNPISPHQISLHSSIIEQKLHPIRCCSPVVLGLRQGQRATMRNRGSAGNCETRSTETAANMASAKGLLDTPDLLRAYLGG